ncbi:MAG: hypothetical protein ABR548_06750 [Actinomycetota bacterium]|nr:hypothetical protein [Actinomycetota bacterium]
MDIGGFRAGRLAAALLTALSIGSFSLPAHAAAQPGTIDLPCVHPAIRDRASATQGVCGWRVTVTPGTFTLMPAVDADLDIYFYVSTGNPSSTHAGMNCAGEHGNVPSDAAYAIIVLSPSACSAAGNAFVGFTYTG